MRALENLEPKKVFYYFEEICNIPHGSGNMDKISDYLVEFAKKRGLFYIQDEVKNVIIVKEASEGYEQEEPVMLQGHMDMVAVKKPEAKIDMTTQPLQLMVENNTIYAKDTSLGGDDGIAVAYALALLDSKEIAHPRLEVVITVDEEVGMDGARAIDLSMLQSKRLVNLDSEEEGIFLTSCAGGARVDCILPITKKMISGTSYQIVVTGLQGGHSGEAIDKERGNSNCLMGRVLWKLRQTCDIAVSELEGGLADNAIPRETKAVVILNPKDNAILAETIEEIETHIKSELSKKDPDFSIKVKMLEENAEYTAAWGEELKRALALLIGLPNGVQAMSKDIDGLVETSLNMGILSLSKNLEMNFSVRSSIESAKQFLIEKLRVLTEQAGGYIEIYGDYPGWAYREYSPLREKMVALYEKMYGKKPEIQAIHAGLECGIISSKINDLDCVSMGPDMTNIHTTEETLSAGSVKRVWDFLVALLQEKD